MGNSIISVYICVRLQLKWHAVYKYKEENPSTTHWDLFERYESNQWRDVPLAPYRANFCRNISWSTTSKAFLRSKNIAPTMVPLSIHVWLSQSFINLINAVWQEWCFRKPELHVKACICSNRQIMPGDMFFNYFVYNLIADLADLHNVTVVHFLWKPIKYLWRCVFPNGHIFRTIMIQKTKKNIQLKWGLDIPFYPIISCVKLRMQLIEFTAFR